MTSPFSSSINGEHGGSDQAKSVGVNLASMCNWHMCLWYILDDLGDSFGLYVQLIVLWWHGCQGTFTPHAWKSAPGTSWVRSVTSAPYLKSNIQHTFFFSYPACFWMTNIGNCVPNVKLTRHWPMKSKYHLSRLLENEVRCQRKTCVIFLSINLTPWQKTAKSV